MFAYNPTVNDRSGEILAGGQLGAAQANADTMKQLGSDISGAIQQFAGMYANNKALDAKAAAYGDFLSRHGAQLGFDPEWIKNYMKAPRDQQLAAGDMLTGNGMGSRLMSLNYLNQQAAAFPRNTGTGGGGGGVSAGESLTF